MAMHKFVASNLPITFGVSGNSAAFLKPTAVSRAACILLGVSATTCESHYPCLLIQLVFDVYMYKQPLPNVNRIAFYSSRNSQLTNLALYRMHVCSMCDSHRE